ncbi:MAG: signal peptidase II [Actinomycetota bacterium]
MRTSTKPGRRNRAPVALLGIAAACLAADQVTKVVAVAELTPGLPRPAIDGILYWTLQRNPGAAFSLFTHFPVAFTVIATGIAVVILRMTPRVRDWGTAVSLGLVLGGALGNLADRVVRAPGLFRGHVVDFIDFVVWPVFNLADVAVVVGGLLLAVTTWKRGGMHDAAA